MKVAFSLAIACFAALYTSLAFTDLAFLSQTGRLGPGFFPRVIGVSLLVMALYSLYVDLKRRHRDDDGLSPFWGVTLVVALLSAALIGALELLGGLVAMGLFMLASLFILNRRQPALNVLLSVVMPVGIYLVFRVWLNAAMPDGLLSIPI